MALVDDRKHLEHKHAVFLKPIRDLAETWDINIASELEEYLQVRLQTKSAFLSLPWPALELFPLGAGVLVLLFCSVAIHCEKCPHFDTSGCIVGRLWGSSSVPFSAQELTDLEFSVEEDGARKLNFAEAALVIQGSAHVYSKKVEFLYGLVYRALDELRNRKRKDRRVSTGPSRWSLGESTAPQPFLLSPLLQAEEAAAGGARPGAAAAGDEEEDAIWDDEDHFLSLDDVLEEGKDIDLPEGVEDAAGPDGRNRIPSAPAVIALLSAGARDGEEGGAPKLSTCAVHGRSGALLIDEGDGRALNARLEPPPPPAAAAGSPPTAPLDPAAAAAADSDDDDVGGGFAGFADYEYGGMAEEEQGTAPAATPAPALAPEAGGVAATPGTALAQQQQGPEEEEEEVRRDRASPHFLCKGIPCLSLPCQLCPGSYALPASRSAPDTCPPLAHQCRTRGRT